MRWLIVLGCVLILPAAVMADSVSMVWDPATGATSYDVQRSADFNPITGTGTWTTIQNVLPAACTGSPPQCAYTDATAPPSGAFYRLMPKNAAGPLPLTRKGVWYCGTCPELPAKPASLGVAP